MRCLRHVCAFISLLMKVNALPSCGKVTGCCIFVTWSGVVEQKTAILWKKADRGAFTFDYFVSALAVLKCIYLASSSSSFRFAIVDDALPHCSDSLKQLNWKVKCLKMRWPGLVNAKCATIYLAAMSHQQWLLAGCNFLLVPFPPAYMSRPLLSLDPRARWLVFNLAHSFLPLLSWEITSNKLTEWPALVGIRFIYVNKTRELLSHISEEQTQSKHM